MTARYKPGSRVQKVWEVYEADGADKAYEFGLTLDLAPGTLRGWVRMWSDGKDKPKAPPREMITKSRVVVTWDPDRVAFLIEEGPEQSIIRWQDTREDRCVSTSHLRKPK